MIDLMNTDFGTLTELIRQHAVQDPAHRAFILGERIMTPSRTAWPPMYGGVGSLDDVEREDELAWATAFGSGMPDQSTVWPSIDSTSAVRWRTARCDVAVVAIFPPR